MSLSFGEPRPNSGVNDKHVVDAHIEFLSGTTGVDRSGNYLDPGFYAVGVNSGGEAVKVSRLDLDHKKISLPRDTEVIRVDALDFFGVDH